MKNRIKLGNGILTISFLIVLLIASSCSQKAYTARSCGINGKTGLHTVAKTQKNNNFDSAMKRGKEGGILNLLR